MRDAVAKGARVVTGGGRAAAEHGRFFEPTVLAEVDHSMRCMTEETFGPTLPVMKVGDAREAVRLANDGPYGLQASVWTRDTQNGERIARQVEAGVCCVNDAQLNYGALELPMGGWKASGLGSRHGPDGIRKYAKRQSLMITPGYAPPRELHMFPYSAEVTRQVGEAMSAARRQRRCSPTRSEAPCSSSATPWSRRCPRRRGGRREGRRRRRSPRLLGAGRLAPGRARGDRGRAAPVGGDGGASSPASARCSTRWPSRGWSRRRRSRPASGSSTPSPTRVPRRSPASTRCAAWRCRSSTRCRTSARGGIRAGTRSAIRAPGARPPDGAEAAQPFAGPRPGPSR